MCDQPLLDRLARRRRNARRLLPFALGPQPCCAIRIGSASLSAAHAIAPAQRLPIEQPAEEIERRRQRRQSETASRPSAIDEVDIEVRLQPDAILCAQLPEERERLVVTSEQHVLAVVDPLACLGIAEGRGPAAQHRLGFEHQHLRAARRRARQRPSDPATPAPITMTSGDVSDIISGTMTFIHVERSNHRLPWARDA